SAHAEFEHGSAVTASGSMDLEKRVLSGGQFGASGKLAQRWLPAGYTYDALSVTGKFEGPLGGGAQRTARPTVAFERLVHSGHLEADGFAGPDIKPLQVRADWKGEGLDFRQAEVA